jgi:outer membrane lipoprotein-sorting protein
MLSAVQPLQAQASPAGALAALREKAASVRTMRSAFTQETLIPMFARPMRSQGRLLFKRPNYLRWEYSSPMKEGFSLKGGSGVRWEDDGLKRAAFTVENDPLAGIIARQLLDWIAFDLAAISGEYGIELLKETPLVLRMTPLRADALKAVAGIVITFSAEGPASLVEIEEAGGGRTSIAFEDTIINGPLEDREFDQIPVP